MHYRHKDEPRKISYPKPEPQPPKKKTGLKRNSKPATLIEKLDRVFSQFVRKSSANDRGLSFCYTCREGKNWKQQEAGHYIGRAHMGTRWDERNVHSQCNRCNVELKGNLEVYKSALIRDYGLGIIQELDLLSKQTMKFSKPDLEEMIFMYQEKLKQLD